MNKYQKTFKIFNFKNLLKLSLLVALISCGLKGETKIILERSAKDITDEINKIKKDAADNNVNFAAFKEDKTGSKVSENSFILEAKMRGTTVAEKFVTAIEGEATKLKKTGSSGEFSAMYNMMLEVSGPLEELGVLRMTKTVTDAAEQHPTTTAEGILEIAKIMKTKLQRVYTKNYCALKKKENPSFTDEKCKNN
ncbi:decorin-binding protein A (plasmid) [Borreliella burgdorferi 29805]|uniref:DbpA n=1 Tax=Borreliella burgdorferi (strain N40) TaxID=521007 RepID=H6VX90_BORBN|nr:decorin-binding protein DbpA [Borreliella burgdorferi]AFA36429.1 DbpA [Borreliella burgdorferi N40]ACO38429.1 decorin-binding protein A [Borreliella burgdorferi 29805]MCD2319449.1 decorin-binding protein DbpA [Borreliella burgdorferi]MCD2372804.1 decorin-binding protein DbpA [Borreliella burgdorferi]MCD2376562.1 decorin-binding protein DbpA [Borreliella burgdorferi]